MWGRVEWLESNRDIACIYIVIALTDWITHEGTTGRRRRGHLIRIRLVLIVSCTHRKLHCRSVETHNCGHNGLPK